MWLSFSTQMKNINHLLKLWWSSVRPTQGFGSYRRPPRKILKWGSVKVAHQPKSDIGSSWIWLAHHTVRIFNPVSSSYHFHKKKNSVKLWQITYNRKEIVHKISNNFGILPVVPKYIELNGLINYKYGSKTLQHTHSRQTINMNSK